MQQALSALHLFRRDVQYIVADGKVQIVDEYTGRVMPDRSWERGMHQLIEAKEGCAITERRQTLARITYQRFFRRYVHLCGMTGTASEAAGELRAVYGLRVVRIPTNRPLRRTKLGTQVFAAAEPKWNAVVDSVRAATRANRAVLIGTRSVDASEHVGACWPRLACSPSSSMRGRTATRPKSSPRPGSRGGSRSPPTWPGAAPTFNCTRQSQTAGGLHVILTEYHESRRIDRQLFGRAGRQGDPGSYESIVALDDELFRVLPASGSSASRLRCLRPAA